ncbi:MAG: hypothetical protein HKP58_03335 [Desulfatitalea sp.]|nr:hypothetical protein [Desulfatitalea sp.]NNJ99426.1 hypothetical protein [Desulfatitalea sp.]
MSTNRDSKIFGIASLFTKEQLRSTFVNFLYIVIGLELIIFTVMLVAAIGLAKEPFPWKSYLFIAFTLPVVITFLFGLLMLAFNSFFFDPRPDAFVEKDQGQPPGSGQSFLQKTNTLIESIRKVPIMLTLFLMIVGSLAAYKLDDALRVIIDTGEQFAKYLLIALGVLLLIATVLALTWLIISYKLRKKHMAYQDRYRQAAMEKLGLLIVEQDQTTIDRSDLLAAPQPLKVKGNRIEKKGLAILPPTRLR